ncbi:putative transporter [Escherichia coli 2730350]|nr:putative transporter [Escherichia coli 2730350]
MFFSDVIFLWLPCLLLFFFFFFPLSVPLLFMAFPGVPLAGRAVVNGASEAVSALAGFHP